MVTKPVQRRYRISYKSLCLLLIGLLIGCSSVAAKDVYFYTENTSQAANLFYNELKKKLKDNQHSLIRVENPLSVRAGQPIVVVQPSSELTEKLKRKNMIGVFKPFLDASHQTNAFHRYIVNDPSPGQQIELAKNLYPKNDQLTLGVILSHKYQKSEEQLKRIARTNNVLLKIEYTENTPLKALTKLGNIDALIALPDENIFNRDTIKSIIKTTYNNNIPLIGFYKGMVNAGATATTYFTFDDILNKTTDVIINNQIDANTGLIWPDVVRKHLNNPVITSLSLQTPSSTHEVKL